MSEPTSAPAVREISAETARPGGSRVTAYDLGATVATWELDDRPVLWLSPLARLDGGRAIRGGVPICFPWFGAGRTGDLSPSHGVARTATWRPVEGEDGEDLVWELTSEDVAGSPGAHHVDPFTARYAVRLGETLDLSLRVTNDGRATSTVEVALHTYLTVGDVRRIEVRGLEEASYLDKVTGERAVQDGPVRLEGETDRVYDRGDVVEVHDPGLARDLVLSPRGSTQTVVWNPAADKAAAATDIPDDAWQGFVCVETAATGDLPLTLEPGSTVEIGVRIVVLPHAGDEA